MAKFRSFWVRLVNFQGSVIDNVVFRLHYKLTLIILLALSILVAGRQYFGSPFSCSQPDRSQIDHVNAVCYVEGTYSVEEAWNLTVGNQVLYPGITRYKPDETRVYHYYYQWVSLALFLQAVLFFVPRYFWTAFESGRVDDMVTDFKRSAETTEVSLRILGHQITSDLNHNLGYFILYSVAEVLNVVNVICQICLMDAFLGGKFVSYGPLVMGTPRGDWETPDDPMLRLFPRMARCDYMRYGSSGDIQRSEGTCLLPVNALNEKIYLFLWFWFMMLATVSCIAVVYRFLIFLLPEVRMRILLFRSRPEADLPLKNLLEQCDVGDWFILYLLSKNLKPSNFRDLVSVLTEQITQRTNDISLRNLED